jgi:cardiolipin synthase
VSVAKHDAKAARDPLGSSSADRALRRAGEALRIEGNAVRLLRDGPEVFASWLQDIARAERFILLENYIFNNDRIGTQLADAIIARARAGVEVYVLYDWFGCIATSRQFWLRMQHAGCKVRAFSPFSWGAPLHSVQRNHRKSLAVDGVIGHVGGLCIGDAWAGSEDPETHEKVAPWRDTAVRVAGPAAYELCLAFDETWSICGPPLPSRLFDLPPPLPDSEGPFESPVRVVSGLPGRSRIYRLTQVLFTNATEKIWITDAYFLTPPTMYEALTAAARDGVDVRVLVPGRSDLPWIAWAGRAGFLGLLEAGVRVFEWDGPMLHAKSTVVDGKFARVGSSNLNLASLLTNWELDVVVEDSTFGKGMEEMFLRDLATSTELVLKPTRLRSHRRIARAEPSSVSADDHTARQQKRLAMRGRSGAAMARAGALVLGVALRRQFQRSAVSVAMASSAALLGLAFISFLYPYGVGLTLSMLCLWLGLGALLRAAGEALGSSGPRRKRRRGSSHSGVNTGASPSPSASPT